MKRKNVLALLFTMLLTATFTTACSNDEEDGNGLVVEILPKIRPIELTQEQKAFVNQNTDFTFNLFRAINQQAESPKSNIISPISVTYLLGMINDGAAGNTAKEIAAALGFGEGNAAAINEFCKNLINNAPKVDPAVKLMISNVLIANKKQDVKFASQFEKDMKNYYSAEIKNLDFSNKKGTLSDVNGWCSKKTSGVIPEILSEKELDERCQILMMNAIYYKATWTKNFDPKDTKNETFTTESGQQKNMQMMHRKAGVMYGENDMCTYLTLPYGTGKKWNMKVLLPKEGYTVNDIINSLSNKTWEKINEEEWTASVDIKLPKFNTTSENSLIKPLSTMGIPSLFDANKAELPNICSNSKGNLFIGFMKQKTTIGVSEEGTEVATTTISGEWTGANSSSCRGEADFHANRPFVYVIQEASSGVIFFIGTYRG
jgi:serpin B